MNRPEPDATVAHKCDGRADTALPDARPPGLMLYGRRRGRALRPGQRRRLEARLPELQFALPASGRLDPRALFPFTVEAVWLELGFGGGEHLAAQAATNPAVGIIGAEIFENGVSKLVGEVERRNLLNIRILMGDGRALTDSLADQSIARAFILFPDPWPKERHKKRRIVAPPLLDALARVLDDGAELRFATDDQDYGAAMLERVGLHQAFRWLARSPRDWCARSADWPSTRYEAKALAAGRKPLYLRFERLPRTR